MLVSMISMSAPIDTAIATAHLLTRTAPAAAGAAESTAAWLMVDLSAPRVDRGLDAHAGAELDAGRRLRHADTHGQALHDLREVARRVVGRQEREARARRAREALDLASQLRAA